MTFICNVCYVEFSGGKLFHPFILELEILKSELFYVLCEIQATISFSSKLKTRFFSEGRLYSFTNNKSFRESFNKIKQLKSIS